MASVHSRRVNNNLVYYSGSRYRALDAIGPNVKKFLMDMVNHPVDDTTGDLVGFTATVVEIGAGDSVHALTDGTLVITNAGNEDDGVNLQLKGEAFKPASGNYIYFGIKLKISDATQSDLLVGLCITDTDLLGGMTDGIYFRKPDASTTLSAVLEQDSTETSSTAHTMVADTYVTLEFTFDGSNLDFYVDGIALTRPVQSNLPDDEFLTPSIHFLNGAAAVKTCTIDWWRVIQVSA